MASSIAAAGPGSVSATGRGVRSEFFDLASQRDERLPRDDASKYFPRVIDRVANALAHDFIPAGIRVCEFSRLVGNANEFRAVFHSGADRLLEIARFVCVGSIGQLRDQLVALRSHSLQRRCETRHRHSRPATTRAFALHDRIDRAWRGIAHDWRRTTRQRIPLRFAAGAKTRATGSAIGATASNVRSEMTFAASARNATARNAILSVAPIPMRKVGRVTRPSRPDVFNSDPRESPRGQATTLPMRMLGAC